MKLNVVSARTGLTWFGAGLRNFWRQPLALAGLFLLFIMMISLLSLIPWVGGLLSLLLLPATTLGLMAATRETTLGRFPMPLILICALRAERERVRSMLLLGAAYAVGFLLVLALSALVDEGQFARLVLLGDPLTPELLQSNSFHNAMLLAMVLYLPLSMLFWHAPALVHWHGIAPLQSLFYSAVACARNFWALTVYTLAWSGLFLGAIMLLISVLALLGLAELAVRLMTPLILLLAAMFFSSIWFTFNDSFVED